MKHTNKVRWAILGAGRIAHAFASDFQYLKNGELVGVAARDKNRAQEFAQQYNIPAAYTYNELYNSNEIDAVYVCTTHNFHFEQCLRCLESGKAVLCEKPITLNDAECKKLVAVAKEKKVFLMEAMWTHFLPAVIKAKQWLNDGRIGKLQVINADFGVPMPYDAEGRLYNKALAGGALLDLGIYPVALATYFTEKEPNAVVASGALGSTGVDERTSMILQYGEVTAAITVCITAQMTNAAYLYGDKGYIKIDTYYRAPSVSIYDNDQKMIEEFVDDRVSRGFVFEMQEATDKILAGELESSTVTHKRSILFQEILTEVRRQIGLIYPSEEESLSHNK